MQEDPAIELICRLFSARGLDRIYQELQDIGRAPTPQVDHFILEFKRYRATIDSVMRFLQGRDETLAHRLLNENFLPQGHRFQSLDSYDDHGTGDQLGWAFGSLGISDRARHIASLYIDDLADVIHDGIDSDFELARYGERLAVSAPTFDSLDAKLNASRGLIERILKEIAAELFERHRPDVLGITAPFPGNVYGAFVLARDFKSFCPSIKTVLGGGYVNTELRELREPKVFDYFDYVTLDDGQLPFLQILKREKNQDKHSPLCRTFIRIQDKVVFSSDSQVKDRPFSESLRPSYDGLPLEKYLSLIEMLNPVNRLWSSGRWNKLILAHGCYWKKCSFCDLSLDYISRYEEQNAAQIADNMEELIQETGQSGFHFVDEAAPPKVLFALAKILTQRNLQVSWWGNLRFEKSFTPKMAEVLARSGCIAVTGGLETASDRLLQLMSKGVSVEQVAKVTRAFSEAGILVHAYLMYGFPTQTVAETIDSLERVRQLFLNGCLQSAFWHRFVATIHSPVGRRPERFSVTLRPPPVKPSFAQNEISFFDPLEVNHDQLGEGLRKAIYNYMHGVGLENDVRSWFDFDVPKAKVPRNLIATMLKN